MSHTRVMIGLPTRGMVSMRWAIAYANLQFPMNSQVLGIVKEKMEIGEARNAIVADTLRNFTDATHILFLDDDVIPHSQALLQLLSDDKPLVSGVYFLKQPRGEAILFDEPCKGTITYYPSTGLHRAYTVPCGLLLVQVAVYQYLITQLDLGKDANGNPKWFETSGYGPGEIKRTEDVYFCKLCEEAGIERWYDTSPYAFGWHFSAADNQGYPVEQWTQFIRGQSITWNTPILENADVNLLCL